MGEGSQSSGIGDEALVEARPLVAVRLAPRQSIWRIAPAWAVLAGVLASGVSLMDRSLALNAVAALVLTDGVWGALRQLISAPAARRNGAVLAPSLPYATSTGPLAQLPASLRAGDETSPRWQEPFLVAVLCIGVSALVGLAGVAASVIALVLIWLAWAFARQGRTPALCLALLDVMLPWTLGLLVALRPGLGDLRALWPAAAVATAFTILQWGYYQARTFGRGRTLVWLGQAVILTALIIAGQAGAAAIVGVLLLPPSWWLARRDITAQVLSLSRPWWLAALLISAGALR